MEHTPNKNWHEYVQRLIHRLANATKANMILTGIGTLLIVIIIFQAGILIGSRKGNYARIIHEPQELTKRLPTAHGTTGVIIAIDFPNLIVTDEDNTEKTIFTKETTIFRGDTGNLTFTDIQLGDVITVIGTPTPGGSLLANFIRIVK